MISLYQFDYTQLSDTGRLRSENQDESGVFYVPNGLLLMVADGMGGHAGGREAAHLAIQTIRTYLQQKKYDNIRSAIQVAFEIANTKIRIKAQQNIQLRGMGATLVLVLFDGKQIYYAHAGDSRLYYYSAKELNLLTKDHSVIQQLLDLGIVTPIEAMYHPQAHKVTSALGVDEMMVSITDAPLSAHTGDIFLLCSDGLNNMVLAEEIEAILKDDSLTLFQKNTLLIQKANQAGGTDNITVVLLEIKAKTE